MTPAEAEMHFLENVKKLSMYGVDLHHAKVKKKTPNNNNNLHLFALLHHPKKAETGVVY